MLTKKQIHARYAVAIATAPAFCVLYAKLFGYSAESIFWLFDDTRSLIFLIILYPIIEELAFRGLIQSFISAKTKHAEFFWGITWANILTSVLFALMHLVYHTPIWAILVFFPSLIFGYFKDKYDIVLPSIFLHMFYNLCFFSIVGN
ncbi:MAG: JDVT-CTERM system CAAX-type protease [Sulfurovum sp.]|nr:JDVT-CTERM system CAAX-type protease [Sulfurovum sp.]